MVVALGPPPYHLLWIAYSISHIHDTCKVAMTRRGNQQIDVISVLSNICSCALIIVKLPCWSAHFVPRGVDWDMPAIIHHWSLKASCRVDCFFYHGCCCSDDQKMLCFAWWCRKSLNPSPGWIRTSMSYHRFLNMRELFSANLSGKLLENVKFLDFQQTLNSRLQLHLQRRNMPLQESL